MKKVKVALCRMAETDHACSARAFAHVFHLKDTICVAPAFYDLPDTFKTGILLHELGHMSYSKEEEHSEFEADTMGFLLSGVAIERRRYHSARHLEYVKPSDLAKVKAFLRRYVR